MQQIRPTLPQFPCQFQHNIPAQRVPNQRHRPLPSQRLNITAQIRRQPGMIQRRTPPLRAAATANIYTMHRIAGPQNIPCHGLHVSALAGTLQSMHQNKRAFANAGRALFHHADGNARLRFKTMLGRRHKLQFLEARPEVGNDGRQVGIGD